MEACASEGSPQSSSVHLLKGCTQLFVVQRLPSYRRPHACVRPRPCRAAQSGIRPPLTRRQLRTHHLLVESRKLGRGQRLKQDRHQSRRSFGDSSAVIEPQPADVRDGGSNAVLPDALFEVIGWGAWRPRNLTDKSPGFIGQRCHASDIRQVVKVGGHVWAFLLGHSSVKHRAAAVNRFMQRSFTVPSAVRSCETETSRSENTPEDPSYKG